MRVHMYKWASALSWKWSRKNLIAGAIFLLVVSAHGAVSSYVHTFDASSSLARNEGVYAYPVVHSDSEMYARLATNIVNHRVYSRDEHAPFSPEINWAPGYPLLLAGSFALFGNALPLIVLQIILAGIAGVLLFHATARYTSVWLAIFPALVYALDPAIAYYTGTAHTDGLFMSLLMILVYALFFARHESVQTPPYFALGLTLGVLALIRTVGGYLIVLLPALYLITTIASRKPLSRAVTGMVTFVLGALLVVTPWAMRNHSILGAYTLGNIGPNMFFHYYVQDFLTLERGSIVHRDFAQSDVAKEVRAQLVNEANEMAREQGGTPEAYYQQVALRHMGEHPLAYAKFHIIGTLPYFFAGSYRHFLVSILGDYQERAGLARLPHENIAHNMTAVLYSGTWTERLAVFKSMATVLLEVFWRGLLLLIALCALFVGSWRNRMLVVALWVIICYFALATGPASHTRYRIVTEPILLTLVGIGAGVLVRRSNSR